MVCQECHKKFQGYPGRTFCGSTCSRVAGRKLRWASYPPTQRTCPRCATIFPVGTRVGKDAKAIYCTVECARAAQREAVTIVKEERACLACGGIFLVGGVDGKNLASEYCSRSCSQRSRRRSGRVCKELSVAEAAYIAGFIDGEGTIGIYQQRRGYACVKVSVANTKKKPIEFMIRVTGIGTVFHRPCRNEKHAPSYWWQASSDAACTLLRQLQPYLLIKGKNAELAIETQARLAVPALKIDKTWQDAYRLKMKALNARGPQPAAQEAA